jgi:hypothetical protein
MIPIFENSFASHIKSKYLSNKNNILSYNIYLKSGKLYIFNCDRCNHEFNMKPIDISIRNRWCPYCSNKKLCSNINCGVCFKKTFASYWRFWWLSLENKICPTQIAKNSNKSYTFNCTECNHLFISTPSSVSSGNWCKFCSNQDLCNNENCNVCYEKSFQSHQKYVLWSKNNIVSARNVFKSSHAKYLFNCNKCNHEFECSPANITRNRNCSYCSNKKLCSKDNCEICYNKSFASSEKSKFWSKKNKMIPRAVFKFSNKKYLFNCNICNFELLISLNNLNNNKWCSKCKNKTENKLYNILNKIYYIKFHPKYDWCKNPKTNRYLPFDFECNNNIIIELDGLQHFKQVSNWKSPEEQLIIDKYKMECAIKNNKHIIRLLQDDVYYDKNNWKENLFQIIDELTNLTIPTKKYINIDSTYFE